MLVITRRIGERVLIGDNVIVTIMEAGSTGRVKLGFTAPQEVRILREELHQKIQREGDRRDNS